MKCWHVTLLDLQQYGLLVNLPPLAQIVVLNYFPFEFAPTVVDAIPESAMSMSLPTVASLAGVLALVLD